MQGRRHRLLATGLVASLVFVAAGRTTTGDTFPPPINSGPDTEARPLPPTEAAAAISLPAPLVANLFAAEPQVQNPIAMAWDVRGRCWIAENYTYAERSARFDLRHRDRVIVLADDDADGVADKRTVFTDHVQMLTGLEIGHDGVWLMTPPRLLFLPDRDHNDQPDGPPQVVLDGFTVPKVNYHNFANGLKWGPDGWLYGRCGGSAPGRIGIPGTSDQRRVTLQGGIWRFHPGHRRVEVIAHGTTNPWGHDWDAMGEMFFINTVNGHLWHMIPGAHYRRPFTLDPNTDTYELIDMHADHWHFDTGKAWNESRDGAAHAYGGGHAHTGMMIYLGDNWPDRFRGNLFTFNMHGRRANQEILRRRGSGFVAHHGIDIMQSADPFYRPLDLSYGPDGAVLMIDWSDTGECHEHDGVHRTSGRVYRIASSERQPVDRTSLLHDLANGETKAMIDLHHHRNAWLVRAARRSLVAQHESGGLESYVVTSLESLLQQDDPLAACRGMLSLHTLGLAGPEHFVPLLTDDHESLRSWGIRLWSDSWPIDDVMGPTADGQEAADTVREQLASALPHFIARAEHDPSGLVLLALASTLQRMPVDQRPRLAAPLVRRKEFADDHNLPLLVWYGLIPVARHDPVELARPGGRLRMAAYPTLNGPVPRRAHR